MGINSQIFTTKRTIFCPRLTSFMFRTVNTSAYSVYPNSFYKREARSLFNTEVIYRACILRYHPGKHCDLMKTIILNSFPKLDF